MADRATDDILIASPRIQLVKRFEERRNAQILKPVLDDVSNRDVKVIGSSD